MRRSRAVMADGSAADPVAGGLKSDTQSGQDIPPGDGASAAQQRGLTANATGQWLEQSAAPGALQSRGSDGDPSWGGFTTRSEAGMPHQEEQNQNVAAEDQRPPFSNPTPAAMRTHYPCTMLDWKDPPGSMQYNAHNAADGVAWDSRPIQQGQPTWSSETPLPVQPSNSGYKSAWAGPPSCGPPSVTTRAQPQEVQGQQHQQQLPQQTRNGVNDGEWGSSLPPTSGAGGGGPGMQGNANHNQQTSWGIAPQQAAQQGAALQQQQNATVGGGSFPHGHAPPMPGPPPMLSQLPTSHAAGQMTSSGAGVAMGGNPMQTSPPGFADFPPQHVRVPPPQTATQQGTPG